MITVFCHVLAMKDSIPMQVQIEPQEGGSSDVVLAA